MTAVSMCDVEWHLCMLNISYVRAVLLQMTTT